MCFVAQAARVLGLLRCKPRLAAFASAQICALNAAALASSPVLVRCADPGCKHRGWQRFRAINAAPKTWRPALARNAPGTNLNTTRRHTATTQVLKLVTPTGSHRLILLPKNLRACIDPTKLPDTPGLPKLSCPPGSGRHHARCGAATLARRCEGMHWPRGKPAWEWRGIQKPASTLRIQMLRRHAHCVLPCCGAT